MRIGILGVAHLHIDSYIGNLRAAGADVVGIHDWDRERGSAWGRRHQVPFFADADQLIQQRPDGVVICSETAFHRDLAERAALAGLSVLCEKPLGVGHDDARAIVDTFRKAGLPFMTAFPTRFHPAVRQARELIASGGLGDLRAFSGRNQSVMPMRERSWFADEGLAGSGAMMDHIVHLADLFCWLSGQIPEQVYAVANRIVHEGVVTVETSALVMLTYPGGLFGSIDCSWNRPLTYPTWGTIGFSIVGDGGTVDVEPVSQRLTVFGGERDFGWLPWGVDTNQTMIEEFLAAVRERREPSITGYDGLVATEIAVAARESASVGRPVPLLLPSSISPLKG
jgi:predicted dehydrogenase